MTGSPQAVKRRLRITPATVISIVALLLAAGGGAYASTKARTASVAGWAVVAPDGHQVRGTAVGSFILKDKTGKVFPGDYQVDFNQNVSHCAYEASLGSPGTAKPPVGDIGVARRADYSGTAVYVRTVNLKGFGHDEGFYLEVIC